MRTFSGFGGARAISQSHSLNLTPMIDVMTIILIFLVKSYSITPEYLSPAKDVQLSAITSDVSAPDKALLIIAKNGITVDGVLVMAFANGAANEKAMSQATLPDVEQALVKLSKTKKLKGSDTLIIQADRELPFDYIKPVLRTAGAAGFHDIKFAGIFEE